jgi:hypothetical protein
VSVHRTSDKVLEKCVCKKNKGAIREVVEDAAKEVIKEVQNIGRRSYARICKKARREMSRGVSIGMHNMAYTMLL